jgi:hypothetical protein
MKADDPCKPNIGPCSHGSSKHQPIANEKSKGGDQSMSTIDRRHAAKFIRERLELPCSEKWLKKLERTDYGPPFAYDGFTSWYSARTLFDWVFAPSTPASYEAARKIRFKRTFLQTSKEPEVHPSIKKGIDKN